ncbi:2-oxoacid:ferredoxin oxidoreductase subunit beta [Flavobacteriaceae bacterium]|nr:2-oxoacid:ferredoxin oxidoreductase subunit beta [Flavobacteriaceae bacterium]
MQETVLKAKDFASNQDVKWCPGCGDYSILKQVQSVLPETGHQPEDVVFVSGIGCSSRFPYYMNTYGIHSIHGRAPAIATGLKMANPELNVWVITGDGDGLSIGGNHLIHLARRNVNVNVLLFNNEIYGLTKGQYSPTSQMGLKTKSSPMGVIDRPFNPASLLFGASASFIARGIDRDPKNLRTVLSQANKHKGTSFVEIYQNCHVFNDGVFEEFSNKDTKEQRSVHLEEGEPLIFDDGKKALKIIGGRVMIVNADQDDLWIHDSSDRYKAFLLCTLADDPLMPRPFGVLFKEEDRPIYETLAESQISEAQHQAKDLDLDELLRGQQFWNIN